MYAWCVCNVPNEDHSVYLTSRNTYIISSCRVCPCLGMFTSVLALWMEGLLVTVNEQPEFKAFRCLWYHHGNYYHDDLCIMYHDHGLCTSWLHVHTHTAVNISCI